jgi:hypothetical protein
MSFIYHVSSHCEIFDLAIYLPFSPDSILLSASTSWKRGADCISSHFHSSNFFLSTEYSPFCFYQYLSFSYLVCIFSMAS